MIRHYFKKIDGLQAEVKNLMSGFWSTFMLVKIKSLTILQGQFSKQYRYIKYCNLKIEEEKKPKKEENKKYKKIHISVKISKKIKK